MRAAYAYQIVKEYQRCVDIVANFTGDLELVAGTLFARLRLLLITA